MEIMYWDVAKAADLAHTYNEQVAGVPHCYPVSPEDFQAGFPYRKYTDDYYGEYIHSEKIIVAMQNVGIAGFADVALAEVEEDGRKESIGFIRFLTYKSGCRSAGQALLEESERYLTGLGTDRIKAYRLHFRYDHGGYRFYHIGFSMISDQLGHICALLHMNGYRISGGEIFMNQPSYTLAKPVPPDDQVEIALEQKSPVCAVLPGLCVRAFRNGKRIGTCESTSAGEFSRSEKAQNWLFITGLFVMDAEQGKGWGRYLLQRNLWEMQKAGYKNTVISTDITNFRAQLFYMNYGYRMADTTFEFVKDI